MVWIEAEVMEKLSFLKLVPKQQTTLDTSIWLDQFLLDRSTQPDQDFTDWKKKLVTILNTTHYLFTLVLQTRNQIAYKTFLIEKSIPNAW